MMTISNAFSVTAGIEQVKVAKQSSNRTAAANVIDKSSQIPTAAELTLQNQQSVDRANNQPSDPNLSAEQIRVSVSTGQSNIRGNLSPVQAAELYEQISKLL
jgi:hypothetical protein